MRNNSSAAVRLELEGELFANVEAWRREQKKFLADHRLCVSSSSAL